MSRLTILSLIFVLFFSSCGLFRKADKVQVRDIENTKVNNNKTVVKSSNKSNRVSSIAIIEERMKEKGLYNQWVQFYRDMPARYYISNINTFIATVESYMGVPYKYSGKSRSGVDCSGLVNLGLESVGYSSGRLNSTAIAKLGRFIPYESSLKRGDIVCFRTGGPFVSHVGIYLGNNSFLHAPSSGGKVSTASMDNTYWAPRFLFGVRLTR